MARKPTRRKAARPSAGAANARPAAAEHDRFVEAFIGLLAEKTIETIGFAEIAAGAGVSLTELRAKYGSKLALLAAFTKDIDRQVLAGIDADMGEEPPRERLFDVLMRRIEALEPHKEAVRSLAHSARR